MYKYIRGAYNKFPDFFRMGIWNCRWLLEIHYGIAIHLMRWLTNFYDFRFKWTATAAIGIHPTKAWLSQLVNFKNTLEERYAIKFCFKLGKMPQKRMECFRLLLEHLAWIEHQFLSGIRDSRESVRDDEQYGRSKEIRTPELIGQRVRVRFTMLIF